VTASRSVLLKTRNVSDKSCRENQNTHFMFNKVFNRKSCNLRGNVVEWDTPLMIIRRIRIACWVTKTTDTHSEYVIFISFARQQRLRERATLSRYVHTVSCLYHFKRWTDLNTEWSRIHTSPSERYRITSMLVTSLIVRHSASHPHTTTELTWCSVCS
jgi:hypothetical protein